MSLKKKTNKSKKAVSVKRNAQKKEVKKNAAPSVDALKIIENLASGLLVFSEGKVVYINKKASEAFGIKKTLLKHPEKIDFEKFIVPEERKKFQSACKTSKNKTCELVLHLKTKKQTIPVEVKMCTKKDKDSELQIALMCDITEREKLQQELSGYVHDFNLILSCIDEVVYYVDKEGKAGKKRVKYISDHIYSIIGVNKKSYEEKSKKLLEYCHPDDIEQILNVSEKLNKEKKSQKFIYRFKHQKTGKYVWLEERIFPQFDKQKKHIGNFGVSRDITAEKNFERQLKESETRFRLLAENANDIIFKSNFFPKPHYEYVSPSVKKILGYTPEEFYKNAHFGNNLLHPEDKHTVEFSEYELKGNEQVIRNARYFHKSGKIVWLETSYTFIRDENNEIISLQGISRDVTKERESELKLEESEKKFRLLAENATDIIFHYRFLDKPAYTYMSPSVKKILGYGPEDFYADPFLGYKLLLEEDRSFMGQSESNARNQRKVTREIPEMTLRYKAKDGRIVWLQTTYSNIKDKDGRIIELEGISRDVSAQKESELALQESERKLNSLLSNLPGMAYRCKFDSNWTMIFVNNGTHELTGYEAEEFINNQGLPFSKIVHPEDILVGRPEIENAIKTRSPFEIEYRIITRQGEIKWVLEKGEGVYDQEGQLIFIEGFISDISQRKKIELELNQRWINFKSLVETSPDGIFIMQGNKVVYANPASLKIIEGDEHINLEELNVFSLIETKFHPLLRERIARLMAGESFNFNHEYKARTLKGNLLEVEVRIIPIIYNGSMAIQIIFHDLTAKKQLEHQQIRAQLAEETNIKLQEEIYERKKVEAELRQTQKFTRLLIDSSLDMICAADKEGRIIEFNAAAQQAFGYTFDEVKGKPLTILYADISERSAILQQMIDRESSFSGEVVNRKKNGETFISYLSATVLKNERGEFIGSMGVSRDITKLKMDELQLRENEERYRAVYSQAFIGIARVDIYNGKFIEVNQRLCEILGYTKEELLVKSTYELTIKEDRDRLSISDQLSGDGFFVQRRYVHRNGSIVYMNLSYSLVKDVNNNPLYFIVVYDDITRNKLFEQELVNQTSKLKAIFESSSHLIWTVNKQYELTSFNQNYLEVIKEKYRIEPTLNKKLQDYLDTVSAVEYSKEWIPKYESVFAGNKLKYEKEDYNSKGEEVNREVFLHPIYDEKNEIVEIACLAHDITDRVIFEKQIVNQSAKLKAIFNSSSHIIWTVTPDFHVTSYNDNFTERINNNKESFHIVATEKDSSINRNNPNYSLWMQNYEKAFSGIPVHFETKSENVNGEDVWTEIFLEPIIGQEGKVNEVSGIAHDITEKKQADDQLKLSLKEKEVLLKEVHHRVKNNLQVISSILNLQSSYVREQTTINLLKECQNRIKSMAFIHESLYQNKDFSNINFSEYLMMLSKNLVHSYGLVEDRIQLEFDVEPVALNLDLSIPCGLIVNELISNALKYAFPEGRAGKIKVSLHPRGEQLILSIADNGIGLPKGLDFRNTESLGLQLVVTLTEQINGEIEVKLEQGTEFLINFTYTNFVKN